ncbi:hypothetical protein [Sinorhizobium medicae]|uniref:hypothetical protein n=1 Tax=Sinorhizobium medicae TaxID=110321 RepID=UPI002B1BDBFF|nr:hypothetical protein [Sinorhizobium medicae]WQO44914.1 hypothetical protein U8C42_17270 [Sinorhizobium medicae]
MRILPFLFWLTVFCLSADSARAGPVAAAISAVAGLLSAGGFAASVIKLAFGFALQYGVSLIEKARAKKRQGAVEARGVTIEVRMGDDQPASFVVGTYATAGIRKYIGTWGQAGKTPNAYLTDVVELSCIPHPGLSGIWIDDTKGTILWNEPHADGRGFPIQEFRVDGKDFAWVRFVDGKQTVADPWLIDRFGSHPERPFKATMIGRGIAYAVVTFRYNTEKFGGLPACLFEMLPMPLYDLRKDSTNGGSGAQRWNDPSTWAPSDNNVVVEYNLIRGIYYGDEWIFGGRTLPPSACRHPIGLRAPTNATGSWTGPAAVRRSSSAAATRSASTWSRCRSSTISGRAATAASPRSAVFSRPWSAHRARPSTPSPTTTFW